MKNSLRLSVLLLTLLPAFAWASHRLPINSNWKFHLGDAEGAEQRDFDDRLWQDVDLPHDWSITLGFDSLAASGNDGGYVETGIGWYRKTMKMKDSPNGFRSRICFDGVYMNAEVFINGHSMGVHPYGYTPFSYDITDYLLTDRENVIAVRVDNSAQKNSRWYSGSGIYRSVFIEHYSPIHIEENGVFVTTLRADKTEATIRCEVDVTNETDSGQAVWLGSFFQPNDIIATLPKHKKVGEAVIPPHSTHRFSFERKIPQPKLWSPEAPQLYTAEFIVSTKNATLNVLQLAENFCDMRHSSFGIRTIEYSAEKGFLLNGNPILLHGGCIHHDNGILGAAAHWTAEARKVLLMKNAGFNAVRTSHNPPSDFFLKACDMYGLLVIDEAFDGWKAAKNAHDYHERFDEWSKKDVQAMVLRDRNHPSVICWSIGNEIMERKSPEAVTIAHNLAEAIHEVDTSRPITSALAAWDKDWEIYDALAAEHDIVGYNYLIHKAEGDHQRLPERVIWQTESYPRDAFGNWEKVKKNSYILGDFVWTAIDYLGESGIGRWHYKGESDGEHYFHSQWPYHGAYCGDIDITGWRKPISHYRQILWDETPRIYMAVREPSGYQGEITETSWSVWPTWESWNWPGWEGKNIDVEIYSRYPAVRLYLNDKLIGEKSTTEAEAFKATFTFPYEEGTLTAVPIDEGRKELASQTCTLATSGKPYAIRITPDSISHKGVSAKKAKLMPTSNGLRYYQIEVVDKEGNIVPNATNTISVEVKGVGKLLALGNADLQETDSYSDSQHPVWKGRALAAVSFKLKKRRGFVYLKASSPGLKSAKASLEVSSF